ncbi:MAG TPA: hypothetical protein VFZ53_28090 [Polyangiaceae bacterium]
MTLADLGILYVSAGAVSAAVIQRRQRYERRRALARALLAVVLWPLWLPVALAAPDVSRASESAVLGTTAAALLEGHGAVRGTPFEALLPRDAVERILGEVRRAGERRDELRSLLARPSFGLAPARAHVERLERDGASPRTVASARLHLANVERLDALRRRDDLALEELGELVAALRTQLVLARYAGSTPEGAGDIVSEMWARVEVLGTTMDEVPRFLDSASAH